MDVGELYILPFFNKFCKRNMCVYISITFVHVVSPYKVVNYLDIFMILKLNFFYNAICCSLSKVRGRFCTIAVECIKLYVVMSKHTKCV